MQNFRAYKRKWWKLNDTNSHYPVSISSHQSQNKQTALFIVFAFFSGMYKLKVLYARPPMLLRYRARFLLAQASLFCQHLKAHGGYLKKCLEDWKGEKQETVSKPEEQALWIPLCRSDIHLRFAGFCRVFHAPPSLAYGLGCSPNKVGVLVLNRQQQIWLWTGASSSQRQLLSTSWHTRGAWGHFRL